MSPPVRLDGLKSLGQNFGDAYGSEKNLRPQKPHHNLLFAGVEHSVQYEDHNKLYMEFTPSEHGSH